MKTDPPVAPLRVVSPAVNTTLPPSPKSPVPTEATMSPPLPARASPVVI